MFNFPWLLLTLAHSIDIPKLYPGFSTGTVGGPILFEVFLDLLCPDSRDSYQEIRQLTLAMPSGSIQVISHMFPLPYHKHAFLASQTTYALQKHCPHYLYHFIDNVFSSQHLLYDHNTMNKTTLEVIDIILTLVDYDCDKSAVRHDMLYNSDAKNAWKYGASRAVSGTPFVFVNGVFVTSDTWSLSKWLDTLKPLVSEPKILLF